MSEIVLTSKGQMTLPKSVRDDLKVGPGDRLDITKTNGGYLITRRRSALDLFKELPKYEGPPVSVDAMDTAVEDEAWERNRPKR